MSRIFISVLGLLFVLSATRQSLAAEPAKAGACSVQTFFYRVAEANAYGGAYDPNRATPIVPDSLAPTLAERIDFSKTAGGRKTRTRQTVLDEVRLRRGSSFDVLMRLGFAVHRSWSRPWEAKFAAYPFQGGFIVLVDRYFQVRILGDSLCTGQIAEIRDTGGNFEEPTALEPDQLGFDCHHDRRVLDKPPSDATLRQLLLARRAEVPGARLRHTVFPNSATPRVREEQLTPDACSITYLAIAPDPDTCSGVKYSILEISGLDCCEPASCLQPVEYHFLSLVDALSLRTPATIKQYIRPGGSLRFTGYPHDQEQVLTRNSPDREFKRVLRNGPGWAGTDVSGCSVDENNAKCWFGGGGTYFQVYFERDSSDAQWFASQVHGDIH
jgi:hypothetical protein